MLPSLLLLWHVSSTVGTAIMTSIRIFIYLRSGHFNDIFTVFLSHLKLRCRVIKFRRDMKKKKLKSQGIWSLILLFSFCVQAIGLIGCLE